MQSSEDLAPNEKKPPQDQNSAGAISTSVSPFPDLFDVPKLFFYSAEATHQVTQPSEYRERSISIASSSVQVSSWVEGQDPIPISLIVRVESESAKAEVLNIHEKWKEEDIYDQVNNRSRVSVSEYSPDKRICLVDSSCIVYPEARVIRPEAPDLEPFTFKLNGQQDWEANRSVYFNYLAHKISDVTITITRIFRLEDHPAPMLPKKTSYRKEFRKHLKQARQAATSDGTNKDDIYIPYDDFQRLTTEHTIQRVIAEDKKLKVDRENFARQVHQEAPMLLAMCVWAKVSFGYLKELMDHGHCDKRLPLRGAIDNQDDDYDDLLQCQWVFLSPVFRGDGGLYQEFDRKCILPLLSKKPCGSGNFSQVFRIQLHPAHQKMYRLNSDRNPFLAMKVLYRPGDELNDIAFRNEVFMLETLRDLRHKHIIRLLTTFKKENTHHLLFPCANCNLGKYMDDMTPSISQTYSIWLLNQLKGLADGVHNIHYLENRSESEVLTYSEVPAKLSRAGYHHDLKPANILHFSTFDAPFEEFEAEYGRLQISDFGIGKIHHLDENTGTGTIHGTPTYAPPESKGNRISRPYDIWSFGCIMLEVLVWLFHGPTGLRAFRNDRLGPDDMKTPDEMTDGFFVYIDGLPTIKDQVKVWIEKLRSYPLNTEKFARGTLAGPLGRAITLAEETLEIDPEQRKKMGAERLRKVLGGCVLEARTRWHDFYNSPNDSMKTDPKPHVRKLIIPPDDPSGAIRNKPVSTNTNLSPVMPVRGASHQGSSRKRSRSSFSNSSPTSMKATYGTPLEKRRDFGALGEPGSHL